MPVPAQPKIYHITHVDNLASIAARAELVSDARRFDTFPWAFVDKIGIIHPSMMSHVHASLANATHQPVITVEPGWYF